MTAQWHRWRQPHCQTEAGNANADSTYEPSKHCPQPLRQGGKSSVYQLAWESNMQQPRPWKLKKEKTPIADQLWVLEGRNVAAAKALAFHEYSLGKNPDSKSPLHWACWFCTPLWESFFFFFFLGLFPSLGTIRYRNYYRNIRNMYVYTQTQSLHYYCYCDLWLM